MISRRDFLAASAATSVIAASKRAAGSALPSGKAAPRPQDGAPNILIFMPDQQNGATVLPGSQALAPNMNRFRAESVTFTSAYCPAPHCCPSRASFMTGLYPSEHGVYNNVSTDTAIHPNPFPGTKFWGQALRDAGYQMGYSGKLHVGRDVTPETCGFDSFGGIHGGVATSRDKQAMFRKARSQDESAADRKPGEILRPGWTNLQLYATLTEHLGARGYEGLDDSVVMQHGIAGMQRMAAAGTPWCVMISNSGAHDPYNVPKKFVDMYRVEDIELPPNFADTLNDKPRVYQRQRHEYWSQLSDLETRDAIRHYYAKCSYQDALFGDMLTALEQTGQADNTLVLYVSDHGDYHGAHGLWMKGIPSFREAYHIPAVVRWPKGVQNPGRSVDAFVDQVDWASTFLDAGGVKPTQKLSGASLLPWLRHQTPPDWRTTTFTQMNGVELYYTQRIVMTKDWKYVYNGFDYDELYDLRNDPHELRNLTFPDVSAKVTAEARGLGLTAAGRVPWPGLPPEIDAVRRDLLSRMWTFADEHNDIIENPYGTVALAPYGPGTARDMQGV